MENIRIILCGCGKVGKEFLQLLADRGEELQERYGLNLKVMAAVDFRGAAVSDTVEPLPVKELIEFLKQGGEAQEFSDYGRQGVSGVEVIEQLDADILVETTPTDLKDGGPGKDHIFQGIERGMDIVSANKGPFVLYYEEIAKKAQQKGCGLHISAATAAALPTLDVGLTCLAGTRISSAEGILNGTTNYILSEMSNNGTSYEDALGEAQRLGIAETDPSYDVEGKDSANKIILIANRIFDKAFTLEDITVKGITRITPDDIAAARADGRVIKLIATAASVEDEVKLSVAPKALNGDHPLAQVNGSEKAITYISDTMGTVTVMGGKSSPVGAAAALLKDLINASKH